MFYELAKRPLFRLDPEEAHDLVAHAMERAGEQPLLRFGIDALVRRRLPRVEKELFGLTFPSPLGIAAGFDKNARMVPLLTSLGFGFIEVGTVTLRPQAGNPKPRMFRYPRYGALVNRLGFNNEGADAVARTLDLLWSRSAHASYVPPLFVNIGRNKDVAAAEAVNAYRACYERLAPLADGVVVNVSSPNTPGLRDLQRGESLSEILLALAEARTKLAPPRGGTAPIIVKIAPDMTEQQLDEIAETCARHADGITATNTTVDRSGVPEARDEIGGLSGRPLFAKSTEVLRRLRARVPRDYPLIGTGGIFDGRDAREKLAAGADLIQAYTGFVYQGPFFASRIIRQLAEGER